MTEQQTSVRYRAKLLALLVCFASVGAIQSMGESTGKMKVLYSNVQGGTVYRFNTLFMSQYDATEDCGVPTHTIPGTTSRYGHMHTDDTDWNNIAWWEFNAVTLQTDLISRTKSMWAWKQVYKDFPDAEFGEPTYLQNCYTVAVDAPVPLTSDAWLAWTDPASVCGDTGQLKSFFTTARDDGGNHVIRFSTQVLEGSICWIGETVEKDASGPVVRITYAGAVQAPGASDIVRKRK